MSSTHSREKEFSEEFETIVYWIRIDPLFDGIRDDPEFRIILNEAETRYNAVHEQVRLWLEEQDLL